MAYITQAVQAMKWLKKKKKRAEDSDDDDEALLYNSLASITNK